MSAPSPNNIAAPWQYVRGLPRAVWTLALATLINRVGVMAMPFLVLYLTQEMGFSDAKAGMTLGLYGAGVLVGAALGGWLSDRIGALRVLKLALFGGGVLMGVFPFVEHALAVQVLSLAWPLVADMARPAALAALTALVMPAQRRQAIALNRLAINLGMSIGPVAGGFLAAWSFPSLFIVNGVTALLAVAFLAWHLPSLPAPVPTGPPVTAPRPAWRDPALVGFLVPLVLASIVFFQQMGPLSLHIVDRLGYSTSVYGLLGSVNTWLIVLFEVPINGWTRHWSMRRGLFVGGVLTALGIGILGFVATPLLFAVGIAVAAFGEMLLFPMSAAHVADLAPEGQTGLYMGAYSFSFGCAFALGPWLGTVALAEYDALATFAGAGVLGLIASVLLYRSTRTSVISTTDTVSSAAAS